MLWKAPSIADNTDADWDKAAAYFYGAVPASPSSPSTAARRSDAPTTAPAWAQVARLASTPAIGCSQQQETPPKPHDISSIKVLYSQNVLRVRQQD